MGCKDIPLERRAKIAATVDMIVSTINLVVQSVSLHKTNEIINDENTTETEKDEGKISLKAKLHIHILYIVLNNNAE